MEERQDNQLKPVVITGPSGVGKGTLITRLLQEYPDNFGFSVSHTTRKPRPGEVHGQHYHFIDLEDMKREVATGKFVEHANVHANMYGTSKAGVENVLNAGKICILDIDVQGADQVKKSDLQPLYIFISPPSVEELEKRLRGRGTETEESIQRRLRNALGELEYTKRPGFWDLILVNDDLERAYTQLRDWIFTHEHVNPPNRTQ